MDATLDDVYLDYWSHTFFDDPKALEEVEDDDFDPDSVAREIGMGAPPDDWEAIPL